MIVDTFIVAVRKLYSSVAAVHKGYEAVIVLCCLPTFQFPAVLSALGWLSTAVCRPATDVY